MLKFKNALVSVSDKSGLVEFLKPLVASGLRVVSTGGTAKYLKDNGIPVVEIAEQTGFPEVMDGRVRTLHPKVHMALLARFGNVDDDKLLKEQKIEPFDLVIGNLYPFEAALKKNLPEDELIEFIDIGGPSFLRSAAKNFERIAVVCDPKDYSWIASKAVLDREDRKKLAAKIFFHTSSYDSMIGATLNDEPGEDYSVGGKALQKLRYGENPQQHATWYKRGGKPGIHDAEILHGKELSFNNLLDIEAATKCARDLGHNASVAVKHNNPCGAAKDVSLFYSVEKMLLADPVSVFGGVVAIAGEVDKDIAQSLSKVFLEVVVAFSFSTDALNILCQKKNLRLLAWNFSSTSLKSCDIKLIEGGFLVQTSDQVKKWSSDWKLPLGPISQEMKDDLSFAWTVCAHLKSNAIALVKGQQTVGLGMGQVNRVDAVEQAIHRMFQHHPAISQGPGVVMASDGFFPFTDSVEAAARAGVKWIIQPGGSLRDTDVLKKAEELQVNLVMTGERHFKH